MPSDIQPAQITSITHPRVETFNKSRLCVRAKIALKHNAVLGRKLQGQSGGNALYDQSQAVFHQAVFHVLSVCKGQKNIETDVKRLTCTVFQLYHFGVL